MATRMESVCIRIDSELKALLEHEATDERRSVNNLISKILWDHMGAKSAPKKLNGHAHKVAAKAAT